MYDPATMLCPHSVSVYLPSRNGLGTLDQAYLIVMRLWSCQLSVFGTFLQQYSKMWPGSWVSDNFPHARAGLHCGHAPGGQSEVHCCSSSNIQHPNCLISDKGENTADSVSHTTASCRHIVYTATNTRDHFRHQKAGLLPYLILPVVISICSYAFVGSNRNQCVYIHTLM